MVGLMGANFSKPLVANKVTHLVCYKFEGEFSLHFHGLFVLNINQDGIS